MRLLSLPSPFTLAIPFALNPPESPNLLSLLLDPPITSTINRTTSSSHTTKKRLLQTKKILKDSSDWGEDVIGGKGLLNVVAEGTEVGGSMRIRSCGMILVSDDD